MNRLYKIIFSIFIPFLFFQSCQDNDDVLPKQTSLDIHQFIWRGLNQMYLWQEEVPDLANNRFKTYAEYETFLTSYSDPKNLFQNLLYLPPKPEATKIVDQFSWIVSDYLTLEQQLVGTTKNNGVEYGLTRLSPTSNAIIGYVLYIIPNSDAALKDIKRGDFFYAVNGINLTLSNYSSLLRNADENYTLHFADLTHDINSNPIITPNGKTIALTKTNLAENPILIKKVITNGPHKIGYLMYNGFYPNYDLELNDAFAYFKSEGITDLVLDLRYNGGGSVLTATRLASMISGQFKNQIFSELAYNNRKSYLNKKYLFTDNIEKAKINSLNLTRLYVLTTKSTASASELIINGLNPYINVIQIGTATYGKNVASVTLYDSPNLTKTSRNPSHRYAMQLIVAHSINSVGFDDYLDGLAPDFQLSERIQTLGTLGDPNEPLFSKAIEKITGIGKTVPQKQTTDFEFINDSKILRGQNHMYFE